MRVIVVLMFVIGSGLAAAEPPATGDPWTGAGEFDPGPGQPVGRASPLAPPETHQFDFMLGNFACHDRIPREGGKVLEFDSTWTATYFLNGMGIQDYNSGPRRSTTNLRVYDKSTQLWRVTYITMPNYYSGVWVGGLQDDAMVLEQTTEREDGSTVVSRLTFFEITPEGYRWKSENVSADLVTEGWSKTCVRVRKPS